MASPRRALALLALSLLALAPVASAAYTQPCDGCSPQVRGSVGDVAFVANVFLDNATDAGLPQHTALAGEGGNVLFTFAPAPDATRNATVNASVELPLTVAGLEWLGDTARDFTLPPTGAREEPFAFRVAPGASPGFLSVSFTVTVDGASESGVLTIEVVPAPAPAPEGPSPAVVAIGLGAAVLVAGGAWYAVARARRPRAKPKSATLQRMEMEKQLEQAKTVEQKAAIQEEIRAVEAEKSHARDLQILEAKRADVERTIDLLKKRHDAGQLTRLQYERMVEKKLDELDRINSELVAAEAGQSSQSAN